MTARRIPGSTSETARAYERRAPRSSRIDGVRLLEKARGKSGHGAAGRWRLALTQPVAAIRSMR